MAKETITTSNKSLVTTEDGCIVNRGRIVIDSLNEGNVANIIEDFKAADKMVSDSSIANFAMGAFVDDKEKPGAKRLADNATLINDGEIVIHMGDLLRKYIADVKKNPEDGERPYDFASCYVMVAGKNSMLINNGTIRVIEDMPEDAEVPIYASALKASHNSTIINNGEIIYEGNGTFTTHVRATMCRYDDVVIINKGKIKIDLDRSATVRVLATIGHGGSIANYGEIDIKSPGRIMTIARFADTKMLNEGKINIVSKARFIENKVKFLYQSFPMACAFYEHSFPNPMRVAPIINRGDVHVHLQGTEASTEKACAFGIFSEMVGMEEQRHRYINTGSIRVTQSGPYKYETAEVGNNVQAHKDYPYDVEILQWKTEGRDFKETKDLFMAGSVRYDFSRLELMIDGGAAIDAGSIKAEDLVSQSSEQRERKDTVEVKGEGMSVRVI